MWPKNTIKLKTTSTVETGVQIKLKLNFTNYMTVKFKFKK